MTTIKKIRNGKKEIKIIEDVNQVIYDLSEYTIK